MRREESRADKDCEDNYDEVGKDAFQNGDELNIRDKKTATKQMF